MSFLRASTRNITIWQVCSSYSKQELNKISTAGYLCGLREHFILLFSL